VIIGRERELAELGRLVAGLPSGPAAVLLQGEAGIGKTTIWEAGNAGAADASIPVLATRAVEGEMRLSFAAVGDLLAGELDQILPALPDPQRDALEVALLLARPRARAPDRRAVANAFLSALRILARRGPVVVAVDDVQWLDAPSASALAFALRRVRTEPVGFLLTRRTPSAPIDWLDRPPPDLELETIEIGPLSLAALQRLLRTRLGEIPPRVALRKVEAMSGGNPFFALELARALAGRWNELAPGEPLPLPSKLNSLVRERVAGLPAKTARALLATAVLAEPTVDRVGLALKVDALAALDPAADAGVIVVESGRIRFRHPLLASSIVESAGRDRVRRMHLRLANVVTVPEERARHLALSASRPDESVAAELSDAARAVASRGAPETAAELAEHASRLTPLSDPAVGWQRRVEAGLFAWAAGDADRAELLLQQVVSAGSGAPRAQARVHLARLDMHAGSRREAVGRYREAEEEAGDDPLLLGQIHEGLAWCFFLTREDVPAAVEHARLAVDMAESAGDDVLLGDALSVQAQSEFFLGGGLPNAAMERALRIAPAETADVRVLRQPRMHWAVLLQCSDRLDEARELLEQVQASAAEAGDDSAAPWVLMRRSQVELLAGNWTHAASLADSGHELALETHQRPLEAMLLCARALVYAHLGREAEARALAGEGLALAEPLGDGIGVSLGRWALGTLELSRGDAAAAVAELGPLDRQTEAAGIIEPGAARWIGDLIEALVLTDELDEATELTDRLEGRARTLERASAVAIAQRSRGLLATARGDLDEALAAIEAAAESQESVPVPFDRARTLLALGSVRRRAGRKRQARDALEAARGAFAELGAMIWIERADLELGRIGGRPSSGGELTRSEQRVAALVAEGHTNREVAAALFLSERTVESHLSHVYRKLGLRSRAELAAKFSDSPVSREPPGP
jgi:DNA-binding NarL/FixJ family response regulator